MPAQSGVLAKIPAHSRAITFELAPGADPRAVDAMLRAISLSDDVLIGLGEPLTKLLGLQIEGLRVFPAMTGPGVSVPSTQGALWLRIAASDSGAAIVAGMEWVARLAPLFRPVEAVNGFTYGGRDLTGYVDGTENPKGDAAVQAAIREDGSSFLAVQRWTHDLAAFAALSDDRRDAIVGRRRVDDVELTDAPESAHVKRTAQESFSPAAFVVRRSTPWSDGTRHGLLFIAFGRTLDAFEVQMRRMAGLDDGIVDGMFTMSRPESGGYYWIPPVTGGALTGLPRPE